MTSILWLITTFACTTGASYPADFAKAICETAYQCLNNDDIETLLGYDDVEECKTEWTTDLMNSSEYEAWEEGDMSFDRESANLCLEEITEVKNDSDCNGSMNWFDFIKDVQSNSCDDVYYTKE